MTRNPQNIGIYPKLSTQGRRTFTNEFLTEKSTKNAIFIDIKAILLIMQVTGLLPIFRELNYFEIERPQRTCVYYTFCIRWTLQATNLAFLYTTLIRDFSHWSYSQNDTDIGNKWIEITLSYIAITVTVLICGLRSRNFLEIFQQILQIDKDLNDRFRKRSRNNCDFIQKYLIGIGLWQICVIGSKLMFKNMERNIASFFVLGIVLVKNGMITCFIVFLAALLRIIEMRFAYLNVILTGYTYRAQNSDGPWISTDTFRENAIFIFRVHKNLLNTYKFINECSHLIIVSYMGYTFYTITENIYYVFLEITTQSSNVRAEIVLWGIAWLILHVSLIRLFCRSCHQVTCEARAITLLLTRIYDKKKDHRSIIDKYLIKTIKQKIEFTAYGFFTLDGSTLFKIFSAVTTYLVILIQFKQLEDAKSSIEITTEYQIEDISI